MQEANAGVSIGQGDDRVAGTATVVRGGDGTCAGSRRDELIAQYLGLARSLARRYANRGENLDDLVQVAMFGLINAADRFDPALEMSQMHVSRILARTLTNLRRILSEGT